MAEVSPDGTRPDPTQPAPTRGHSAPPVRVLVAGVGNVLRSDDGFGVEVARRLAEEDLPEGVRVVETGIGGIALVHELSDGFDAMVVADAVDRGREPGTIMVIEPEVDDIRTMSLAARHDFVAGMHLAPPRRAFMLARALGTLPERLVMVGCQPVDAHTFAQGLSEPVAAAVDNALVEVRRQVGVLTGSTWEGPRMSQGTSKLPTKEV